MQFNMKDLAATLEQTEANQNWIKFDEGFGYVHDLYPLTNHTLWIETKLMVFFHEVKKFCVVSFILVAVSQENVMRPSKIYEHYYLPPILGSVEYPSDPADEEGCIAY